MIQIREISASEFESLRGLPPSDWNTDLPKLVSFHFGHAYYYPIVAMADGRRAGFANGIIHGNVGWLGNIIVREEFRGWGVGTALTEHLIEYIRSKGCSTQLLIASAMGKNIYARAGFQVTGTYRFYRREKPVAYTMGKNIGPIGPRGPIKTLDLFATGEQRSAFLDRFLTTAQVCADSGLRGFYLPDYGSGLVVAHDPEAGIALLRHRLNEGKTTAVVPSSNSVAVDFLLREGFQMYREVPRMVLGDDVEWHPEMIFSRGSGYAG